MGWTVRIWEGMAGLKASSDGSSISSLTDSIEVESGMGKPRANLSGIRSWRYGVDFRLENAGDGRSLFLLGAYFGSFRWVVVFWNAFGNILKRGDWEGRGRSKGVIEIFRKMDKKACFSFFERHCPGERCIRYFYAWNIGGWLGTLVGRQEKRYFWLKEQKKTLRNTI